MRDQRRYAFAALLLAALGAVALFVACSSDDPSPPATGDDAAVDSGGSPPPSSEASVDGDAGARDAGDAVDGAGRVGCSSAGDCDRNIGQYCCVIPDAGGGGAAPTYACAPDRVNACVNGGDRICDERADCQGTAYCCAELDSGVVKTECFYGARCNGAGPKWEVCRPGGEEECEPGKTCRAVTCPGQGTLFLCDVPPGCQ